MLDASLITAVATKAKVIFVISISFTPRIGDNPDITAIRVLYTAIYIWFYFRLGESQVIY